MDKNNQYIGFTLIQPIIQWKDKKANFLYIENLLEKANPKTNIILLPETFTTGFVFDDLNLAEKEGGETMEWMKKMSYRYSSVVVGTYIVKEKNKYFNRLFWVNKEEIYFYDKKHLFFEANEKEILSTTGKKKIFQYKNIAFSPSICYDLRFPVWCRNVNLEYDCLLVLANWPAQRIEIWDTLLKARAIENNSYVIGINIAGVKKAGKIYNGHSACYNPEGKRKIIMEKEEHIAFLELDFNWLKEYRKKTPIHIDADGFQLL